MLIQPRFYALVVSVVLGLSLITMAEARADEWDAAGCRDYPYLCRGVQSYKCAGPTLRGTVQVAGRGQIQSYIAFTSKAAFKLASGRKLLLERKKGKQTSAVVIVGEFPSRGPSRIGGRRPTQVTWDGTPTVYYGETDYGSYHKRNIGAIYYHLGKNYVLEVLNGGEQVNGYRGNMYDRRETFSCVRY